MKNNFSKNIISFSLWGDSPFYNVGAIRNAEAAQIHFQGWVCRYYIGPSTPNSTIEQLKTYDNTEVIMMEEDEGWDGMFWRFYAMTDPEVGVMISRDVDCRLTNRDAHAVNEWLQSGKAVHIMRDHPMHGEPIMGGMWGCRTKELCSIIYRIIYEPQGLEKPKHIKEVIAHWLMAEKVKTSEGGFDCIPLTLYNNHGIDQKFLRNIVYRTSYKNDTWIHDSFPQYNGWSGRFQEQIVPGTKEQNTGFPTMRLDWNDFIGQIYFEDDTPNEESAEYLRQRDECIYMDYPKHDKESNEKSD